MAELQITVNLDIFDTTFWGGKPLLSGKDFSLINLQKTGLL